jgi:Ca2+/H+ antiporter, TMEM165/GDT1 family
MDIAAALRAFAAVFPAELPDKTMIATVVLVARYQRPVPVWCGAATAFTLHVTLAVAAGQVLSLLPRTGMTLATAALFGVGAVVLWREAAEPEQVDTGDDRDRATTRSSTPLAAYTASFGVVMLAEAGDLTQLATAGIAASSGSPVAVGVGALAALWLVAGLAATLGRRLVAHLPVHVLQRAAAMIFAALATLAVVSALTG